MPKSVQESEEVCTFGMSFILQKSDKMLQDNRLVRKHLHNFAKNNAQYVEEELVAQAGEINTKVFKENKDLMPYTNGKKDAFSFRSVKTIKSSNVTPSKNSRQLKRSGILRNTKRQSSISVYSINKKPADTKNHKFIDLSQLMPENNGQKNTISKKQEIQLEQMMRHQKIYQKQSAEQQRLEKVRQCQQKEEKEQLKKEFFQKQLSRNKASSKNQGDAMFTTDLDGNIVFFNLQDGHRKSVSKRYPPSAVNVSFQEQEQPELERVDVMKIKQKAARGEAFASAVLKTMNMSRISLNMGNTTNIDHYAYMKRNDLFNNNHSRQVTTIPFLQITEGTNYIEPNTNLSVSKKNTQRTYHSEMKSNFRTHRQRESERENRQFQNQNSNINGNKIEKDRNKQLNIRDRRSQSSRPYRPKSCIPNTARTAGRITSFNQELVSSLLE